MKDVIHTYPIEDLHPHKIDGLSCPCRPRIDEYEYGICVIHNAWDGREILERAIDELDRRRN